MTLLVNPSDDVRFNNCFFKEAFAKSQKPDKFLEKRFLLYPELQAIREVMLGLNIQHTSFQPDFSVIHSSLITAQSEDIEAQAISRYKATTKLGN